MDIGQGLASMGDSIASGARTEKASHRPFSLTASASAPRPAAGDLDLRH